MSNTFSDQLGNLYDRLEEAKQGLSSEQNDIKEGINLLEILHGDINMFLRSNDALHDIAIVGLDSCPAVHYTSIAGPQMDNSVHENCAYKNDTKKCALVKYDSEMHLLQKNVERIVITELKHTLLDIIHTHSETARFKDGNPKDYILFVTDSTGKISRSHVKVDHGSYQKPVEASDTDREIINANDLSKFRDHYKNRDIYVVSFPTKQIPHDILIEACSIRFTKKYMQKNPIDGMNLLNELLGSNGITLREHEDMDSPADSKPSDSSTDRSYT